MSIISTNSYFSIENSSSPTLSGVCVGCQTTNKIGLLSTKLNKSMSSDHDTTIASSTSSSSRHQIAIDGSSMRRKGNQCQMMLINRKFDSNLNSSTVTTSHLRYSTPLNNSSTSISQRCNTTSSSISSTSTPQRTPNDQHRRSMNKRKMSTKLHFLLDEERKLNTSSSSSNLTSFLNSFMMKE